jgi:hypothetical protein
VKMAVPMSAFIVNQYCSSSRSPSLVSTLFTRASCFVDRISSLHDLVFEH